MTLFLGAVAFFEFLIIAIWISKKRKQGKSSGTPSSEDSCIFFSDEGHSHIARRIHFLYTGVIWEGFFEVWSCRSFVVYRVQRQKDDGSGDEVFVFPVAAVALELLPDVEPEADENDPDVSMIESKKIGRNELRVIPTPNMPPPSKAS